MERQQGEQAGAPLGRPPRQRSQPSRFERARALQLEGRLQEAETLYRQALATGEENADLLSNLSVLCWQRGDYEEMELLLRRALALAPTAANIHFNLALVLAQREASDEAIRHYRHALGSASGSLLASVHWNLSKLLLRCGQYSEGWSHYEWRSRRAQPLPPICQPGMRRWDGRGRVSGELLLVGEQGLGDMLQFLRYAPAMAAFADRVTLCLPEPLQPLVQSSGLPVSLIPPEMAAAQRSGHWLPLLSAPALLGVTPAEVVVAAPYLSVPHQRVEHWRQQLRHGMNSQERLIALHWQGNPAAETNELQGRSLPVRALEPLGQLAGVRFVSLQKGAGSEQPLGAAIASKLVPSQAEVSACWDFVETGAIALACDLLISSDSALPHLAGALGVPTWLLLHHSSDWRWGEAGDSTFWYPSMRLFRQQRPGDWPGVIASVRQELERWIRERAEAEPAIDSPMPPDSDSDGNKIADRSLGQGDRLGCDSPVREAPAPPGLQVIVKPSVWRSHVITLDPEGPRFQAFTKDNPSLNPEIMLGLRGDRIAPEERIAQGLVTEALSRSGLLPEGTFGCALSHRQLWQQACNEEGGTLILEDDVITHPHLRDWIDEHQQQLLQRHITHFSVNTDSVLTILTPQGLVQSSLFEPKRPDSTWISQALRATKASDMQLVRFLKGFGMCCYFLSPEGANRLLASTFPLTLETAPIPLISKAIPGFSIDRRLNAFYPTLRASLTLPFLAYTPNNDSSTQS